MQSGRLCIQTMSSELIGLVVAAVGAILFVGVAVGLPALAVVAMRFFKFRERELTLEMEFRQKTQQSDLALAERVQRLEDALASLDRDVREKLGIGRPSTPLAARPDLLEGPGGQGAGQERSPDPSRTR